MPDAFTGGVFSGSAEAPSIHRFSWWVEPFDPTPTRTRPLRDAAVRVRRPRCGGVGEVAGGDDRAHVAQAPANHRRFLERRFCRVPCAA